MTGFTYESLPGRVVFGPGRVAEVAGELDGLGRSRAFLITDAAAAATGDLVAEQLGARLVRRWDEVVQHVPVELADRAREAASEAGADVVVCLGGGSSTGLAKALALSHDLPILAVPTTYAGSEMTPIYGLTGGRHKQTGRDVRVLPKVVVYDPELTLDLPTGITGPSAFNALAHCVEALYAPGCNPVTSALALEGVRALHRSLPVVMNAPRDLAGRSDLLYGAYLAGVVLGATGTGLHHKLCHVLGGTFNLVHADTHSVILPHAVAFNRQALPAEMGRLAEALGDPDGDPAGALWDLAVASHVPTSLADLGLEVDDLPEAARRAAAEITVNPAPVDEAALAGILVRAYAGDRPVP
ncbi:MAG TPA: maleylacetate reductase [Acidimicrobiales bacterium]|nr:maleylacetate reductase [Acidimicrobiales bacterium]